MDKNFRQGWVLAAREDIMQDGQAGRKEGRRGGGRFGGCLAVVPSGDPSPVLPGVKLRYRTDHKCSNSLCNFIRYCIELRYFLFHRISKLQTKTFKTYYVPYLYLHSAIFLFRLLKIIVFIPLFSLKLSL
jgi:hypothetical protein